MCRGTVAKLSRGGRVHRLDGMGPQNCWRREELEHVPLTDVSISEPSVDLLAMERVTEWGRRVEFIDLSLKQPVLVVYTEPVTTAFPQASRG